MSRKIRVRVERTFNRHTAGHEFAVEETDEVKRLIAGRYFSIIAIESEPDPVEPPAVVEPEPVAEVEGDTKPKPKAKKKPAAKKKSSAKKKSDKGDADVQ